MPLFGSCSLHFCVAGTWEVLSVKLLIGLGRKWHRPGKFQPQHQWFMNHQNVTKTSETIDRSKYAHSGKRDPKLILESLNVKNNMK